MNTTTTDILIRPTYEKLCRELEHDPADSGDPDKADPMTLEQGFRTEARLVEPGETFEIARGWEGCIGEPPDDRPRARIIDPTRAPPDDEITDDWGLHPGRYAYDGKDVKIVEMFDDENNAATSLTQDLDAATRTTPLKEPIMDEHINQRTDVGGPEKTNLPPDALSLERETSIEGLFSYSDITFRIPPYQRAYAWETVKDRKQVVQFLDDLKEHPRADGQSKSYFLGHFLFERAHPGCRDFFVIDGQQRLTTVVIFFHCLSYELAIRKQRGELLQTGDGTQIDPDSVRRTFVMEEDGSRKLRTVDYDDSFFRSLLIRSVSPAEPTTRSGERLREAINLMAKRMSDELSTDELIRWMELVKAAVVTTFEVNSKEQATQIFAFQNDRGKDLTNLEKLKAFLMHVVYVNSPVKIEREAIADVERSFANIYRLAEEVATLKEDQVLAHHLAAFVGWTDYPVELLKKHLLSKGTGPQQVEWIRTSFCATLEESFRNVTELERLMKGSAPHERLIGDMLHLQAPAVWPLLLKLMHFHSNTLPSTLEILRLTEITLFKLQFMKGKSTNRLPNIANGYAGDLAALQVELAHVAQHGFQPSWDFNGGFRSYLEGTHHYDIRTRYLLWKYENDLRANERGVHHLSLQEYLNETGGLTLDGSIEHIMPQDPETLIHTEEFKRDYLHNLGNLMLMTRGRNSSLKNKLPREKADALSLTPYLSHQEVVKTIRAQGWTEKEIALRKQQIADFALRYWRAGHQLTSVRGG